MPDMRRTLFMDFGTHEAAEIQALFCSNFLARIWLAKTSLLHNRSRLEGLKNLWRYALGSPLSLDAARAMDLVMVEPFVTRGIANIVRSGQFGSVCFLNSVVSSADDVVKQIHLANDSLGHSIYRSKPRLTGRSVDVLNINIAKLIDLVIGSGRHKSWDKVIVRLNIEGAEIDVLDAILSHRNLLNSKILFMGSLGDIEKCHGAGVLEEYELLLAKFEHPFIWFTSNPNSWVVARKEVEAFIQG